jgi:hypothetical protein
VVAAIGVSSSSVVHRTVPSKPSSFVHVPMSASPPAAHAVCVCVGVRLPTQSGDEFTDNFYLFALRLKRATDARAGGDTSVPTVSPSVAHAILHSMSKSFAATGR